MEELENSFVWEWLESLGMKRLPKWEEINSFDKTVVFTLPTFVGEILAKKHNLIDIPEVTVIRKWIISWSKNCIKRADPKVKLTYRLLRLGDWWNIESCVSETNTRVWSILWNMTQYVTTCWDLYTAERYYNEWFLDTTITK